MDRGFYNDDFDFEQLLRQRSDQLRMYPSEKVWRNIRKTIRNARYGYGLAILVLLGAGSYLSYKNDLFSVPAEFRASKSAAVSPNGSLAVSTIISNKNHPTPTGKEVAVLINAPKPTINTASYLQAKKESVPSAAVPDKRVVTANNTDLRKLLPQTAVSETVPVTMTKAVQVETQAINSEFNLSASALTNDVSAPLETQSTDDKNEIISSDADQVNWLQEHATFDLLRPGSKKLRWQLHATPTINYRNIAGHKMVNIASELTSVPMALNIQGNIDNLLNHKPAMGFEMGTSLLYALSKKLSLKAGVQFNYASYDIQAYSSSATEMATIAISTVTGSESLTSYTNIRNFGGSEMKALKNEYFQLSLPIGMEYTLLGSRRVQFTLAGTLQPTYMLSHDNYLITTDYKNYTREPSLLRRFNLNTSAEAFLSYNMGDMRIQLGPQFRYQIFSSFASGYPVKEHLKEFGFKLGITKSIR